MSAAIRSAIMRGLVAGTLLSLCGGALALDAVALFEQISPSVWIVRALDAQEKPIALGSGVVIAPGKVVTNCHVLAKARHIQIKKDNVSYSATLEFPDPERDLCQLNVRSLTAPGVAFASIKNLKIGQRVYAIGNPLGLELTMSEGIISSLRDVKDGSPLIQTTAPISQGSSGGGLFDTDGQLIGITTFSARNSQNLNFAHPADWITELPERGAAILARRAASPSTAASPAEKSADSFPRTLVSEALSNHIRSLRRVRPRLFGVDWIQFSPGGDFQAMGPSTQSPLGQLSAGGYKLDTSKNTVCITLFRVGMNANTTATVNIPGCYNVIQTAENSFTLRSVSSDYEIPYDLNQ